MPSGPNFGTPDLENLIFPSLMKVGSPHRTLFILLLKNFRRLTRVFRQIDYIRVYQRTGQINIGCDPPGYPTTDYIDK